MRKKGKIIKLAEEFSVRSGRATATGRAAIKKKHYDYGQSIQLDYNGHYEAEQEMQPVSHAHTYFNVNAFDNVDDRFEVESFAMSEMPDEIIQHNTLNESEPVTLPAAPIINPPVEVQEKPRTQSWSEPNSFEETESLSEDALSFQKDIQDILTGQKKYVPGPAAEPAAPEEPELSQQSSLSSPSSPKGGHQVFDDIALSLSTANSFDLGSLNLQKTFDEFDNAIRREEQRKMSKATSSAAAAYRNSGELEDLDYVEDVSAIRERSLSAEDIPAKVPSPVPPVEAVTEKPQPADAPVQTTAAPPAEVTSAGDTPVTTPGQQ